MAGLSLEARNKKQSSEITVKAINISFVTAKYELIWWRVHVVPIQHRPMSFCVCNFVHRTDAEEKLSERQNSHNHNDSFENDNYRNESLANDTVLDNTLGTLSRETFIYIYAAVTLGTIVITLMRSFAFFSVCMRASVNLHDLMFRSITRATMYFFNTNPSGKC